MSDDPNVPVLHEYPAPAPVLIQAPTHSSVQLLCWAGRYLGYCWHWDIIPSVIKRVYGDVFAPNLSNGATITSHHIGLLCGRGARCLRTDLILATTNTDGFAIWLTRNKYNEAAKASARTNRWLARKSESCYDHNTRPGTPYTFVLYDNSQTNSVLLIYALL